MSYYSDEFLEEVRSRSDIVDVIGSYVKLKKSGSTHMGLCPFHNEKTPSFSVTQSKQLFYCFGCHVGGSVFTFIEQYENCSFSEAVEFLANRAGIAIPETRGSREEKARNDLKAALLQINREAGAYYYYQLRSPAGAQGMEYLKNRMLTDETMKNFGLGYAGKAEGGLYRYLKEKGYSDELLRQSGLMNTDNRKGLYDKFWNRVMFPIMDVNNRLIGFGGRVMGDGKPKYLNSPESEVFNKRRNLYALNIARRTREKYLILCEGYMDVIAMHQAGFTNAVASLGTALTQEHAMLLARYTKNVVLSYDSDTAGTDAALRAIPMLRENSIHVRVLDLSPYKDPDEFIRAEGTERFRERIEEARNAFTFETDILEREFDLSDPDSRTAFLQQVAGRIAGFELEAARDSYMKAVCEKYGVSLQAMTQMVNRQLVSGVTYRQPRVLPTGKERTKDDGLLEAQRLLLTWLTQYPSFYPILKEYVTPEDFSDPVYQKCAQMLYEQLESGQLSEAAIIDSFEDAQAQSQVAGFFHARLESEDPQEVRRAMRETIAKVAGASMNRGAAQAQPQSLEEIQQIIEKKKQLEKLGTLQIDL